MAEPCSKRFSISIVAGEVRCVVIIQSTQLTHNISVDDLEQGRTLTILFSYNVGKPKRTVFASSYTKARSGFVGTPPDLGVRGFSRQPDNSLDPEEVDFAEFTVEIPPYEREEGAIGDEVYTITIWLRGANERILVDGNPPPNLEPANPQ